ncbi:MAG TPA: hypothetical protein PKJ51_10485, partial [Methanothrix sp.]|nr:hypothetical protein [Methanothrix sp.]
ERADYAREDRYATIDPDTGEPVESVAKALVNPTTGRAYEPNRFQLVSAGPDGMECERLDREDPQPFRIDPSASSGGGASWHLTITYGGPAGDALGARARWLVGGEVAAECIIDAPGLAEAFATGRLAAFFDDLASWLLAEVRPRGLATRQRMEEAAGIAKGLARDLRRWEDSAGGPRSDGLRGDGIEGRDRGLRG